MLGFAEDGPQTRFLVRLDDGEELMIQHDRPTGRWERVRAVADDDAREHLADVRHGDERARRGRDPCLGGAAVRTAGERG